MPRESSCAARVPLLDQFENLKERFGPRLIIQDPICRGDELEVLPNSQRFEQPRVIRHVGKFALGADGSATTSCAAIRKWPRVGGMMPAKARNVLVFPAPFGPTNPRISPARNLESQCVDRDGLAIRLVKILDDNDRPVVQSTWRREYANATPCRAENRWNGRPRIFTIALVLPRIW